MTVFMVLAVLYGLVQLGILSWPTRSVRLATVLLMVPVGMYGAGVVAAGIQVGYTRAVSAVTGQYLGSVVETASWTVAPVVEELVKVLPLLLIAINIRARFQWGFTDYVVLGGAIGSGFALLEAVLRNSSRAGDAQGGLADGWFIPSGSIGGGPYVPGPLQALGGLFPAPAGIYHLVEFKADLGVDMHLAWTALCGLGVGLLLRGRGPARMLGLVPFGIAIADHAANNYNAYVTDPGPIEAVMNIGTPARVIWPVLALVIAIVLDARVLRQVKGAHPDVLTTAERQARSARSAMFHFCLLRPPASMLLGLGFLRARRAAAYAFARTPAGRGPGEVGPLVDVVRSLRGDIEVLADRRAWDSAEYQRRRAEARRALREGAGRRGRALLWIGLVLWVILLIPLLAFYVIGGFPQTSVAQSWFSTSTGFKLILLLTGLGILLLTWRLIAAMRGLRRTAAHPLADVVAAPRFQILVAGGALLAAVAMLIRVGIDPDPTARAVPATLFLLEALSKLLEIGGLLLILAPFFLPPPLGIALRVITIVGGGTRIITVIGGGARAIADNGALVGGAGLAISEIHDPYGSGGGSGGGRGGPAGGEGENFLGTGFDKEELAQIIRQHAGVDNPSRPSADEILEALTRGTPKKYPGRDAYEVVYRGIKVIINNDSVFRSTAFRVGGGAG